MNKKDFHFNLPPDLIAQTPLKSRDSSRLLSICRSSGTVDHRHFFELPELLRPGDCLVLNDSRVLPARLIGRRDTGGIIEVLLLRELKEHGSGCWECMVRPGKRVTPGTKLIFGDGELTAAVISVAQDGNRIIKFFHEGIFLDVLERLGQMPLPPYIKAAQQDPGRYQTVYAGKPGSAAAPTAGLHFTHELLGKLDNEGIRTAYITLHVGPGTFKPVKTENIEDHVMHSESFCLSAQTAETINRIKKDGGRIIAVGTTSCRVLESVSDINGAVCETSGQTDIFIYPGYKFKCIDGLITNFHLPGSTLIMLVSAFLGRERTLDAYREAIERKYRFYSFGDAMLIM